MMHDIDIIMHAERLYLLPDLRLSDLSARMGVGRATLSACINKEAGVSFSEYVNKMRIAHALEIMEDRQNAASLSVIQIAEQSGFSNESSYYRAFKKAMGKSPRQWLEQHQSQ